MKLKLIIIAACLGLFYFSCTKENTQNTTTDTASDKPIKFKLDGVLVEADSAKALLYNNDLAPHERLMDLIGYKNGNILFEATFLSPKIGKQTLGDGGNQIITYKQGADLNEYYTSKNGTINLTVCDTLQPNITASFETMLQQVLGGSQIKIIKEGSLKITNLAKK